MGTAPDDYDRAPYLSQPFQETQPARLRAAAFLFELDAPDERSARVLEVGCASGGNLVPLAYTTPESRFVGVDFSRVQIERAQAFAGAVGVSNIELRHDDLMNITPDWGRFDYIIAHGIFSWVPAAAREKLLDICKENLSETGIAYISYNTYPGWHMRGLVRDVMLFHGQSCSTAAQMVEEGKALVQMLSNAPAARNKAISAMWREEFEQLARMDASHILHDHLEADNQPFYFSQFMSMAHSRGLQYLADAMSNPLPEHRMPSAFHAMLIQRGADAVCMQQYVDFCTNQHLRRSLLCRAALQPDAGAMESRVQSMHLVSNLARGPAGTLGTSDPVRFSVPGSITSVEVTSPLFKGALALAAGEFPASVPVSELPERVSNLLRLPRDRMAAEAAGLASFLVQCWHQGMVELYCRPPEIARSVSQRPRASAVARHQAAESRRVTCLRHQVTDLDDVPRRLLMSLDGTRTVVEAASAAALTPNSSSDAIQKAAALLARRALLLS